MVPNSIAAECLDLGRTLIENETAALMPDDGSPSGGE